MVMKWEYLIVKPEDYCDKNGARDSHFWVWPSCLEVLNKYGKDGWELCWFGDSQYWFKRPIQ